MESQRPWTRREFLKTTALAAFIPSLPHVSKSSEERYGRNFEEFISAQDPHNRIQLNALYKIPESLIPRSSEAQNIPLHMRPLMDCWRAGSTILDWIGKDVYFAYLAGVNEAVARGQEAVAVLEMPVDWNQDWKDWPQYLGWLVPQVSATDWVIGNEMWDKAVVQGKPPRGRPTGWGNWRYYAQLFAQAYDEIKKVHPDTRIVLTAPHYYGQTEILQHQLDGLDTQNTLRASGGKPAIKLDAISLHYYDKAGNLPDYVGLHKQELKRRGLSIPIILTELGRARGERYSEAGRVFGNTPTELFKRVLMSCALLNEGMLDSVYYYTALTDEGDTHSLFYLDEDWMMHKTSNFQAHELARRLGKNAVLQKADSRNIEFVTEMAGRQFRISWDIGHEGQSREEEKRLFVYDPPSAYQNSQNAVLIRPVGRSFGGRAGPAHYY